MDVTFIVGEICSGKTTYGESLNKQIKETGRESMVIELGDIVRRLKNTNERIFDASLDTQLNEEVQSELRLASEEENLHVIIIGVRQISLLNLLRSNFNHASIDRLVTPIEILRKRFIERSDRKDDSKSFEDVVQGDNELGLQNLLDYLTYPATQKKYEVTYVQNY